MRETELEAGCTATTKGPHRILGQGQARQGEALQDMHARRPWQHGSSQQQPDHSPRSSSMMPDAKQRADADPAMGRQ